MSGSTRGLVSAPMGVAVLALVAALGGAAAAEVATPSTLDKREKKKVRKIAARQLDKRFPVEEAQIADGAVTVRKIGDGAVTSAKIGDGQVGGADVNEASLGSPLVRGVEIVTRSSVSNSTDAAKNVTAPCPAGKRLVGGGAQVRVPSSPVSVALEDNGPAQAPSGPPSTTAWFAHAEEYTSEPNPWSVRAYAICAAA